MIHLVDVNVLIALLDPWHVFHDRAHHWFDRSGNFGWATCPIVQNGLIRILGHHKYPDGPGTVIAATELLQPLLDHQEHHFWSDSISLLDGAIFDLPHLGSTGNVTDTYLLGLAVSNDAALATFDRRLSPEGVRGGRRALHVID